MHRGTGQGDNSDVSISSVLKIFRQENSIITRLSLQTRVLAHFTGEIHISIGRV